MLWLISKFMMSQQIIVISILPNISRRKSNRTMKVSQRIEYNKRNSFLERSYIKCDGEASPRTFHEKSKLSISLDQQSEISDNLLLHVQKKFYQNFIKINVLTTCADLSL